MITRAPALLRGGPHDGKVVRVKTALGLPVETNIMHPGTFKMLFCKGYLAHYELATTGEKIKMFRTDRKPWVDVPEISPKGYFVYDWVPAYGEDPNERRWEKK